MKYDYRTLSPAKTSSKLTGDSSTWRSVVLANVALFHVLFVAGYVFRWLPAWITLVFWVAVPLSMFPSWIDRYWDVWDSFLWTKIFSMMPFATLWCCCSRLELLGKSAGFYRVGSFIVMSVNIFEASMQDVVSSINSKNWNYLNGISGLLLILGEIASIKPAEIKNIDVAWSLGHCWVFSYTLWNWLFMQNNYPHALGRHSAVLLSALALAWINGFETWAQARCHTLAVYFLIRNSLYEHLRRVSDVPANVRIRSKHNHDALRNTIGQVLCFAIVFRLLRQNAPQGAPLYQ